MVRMANIKDVQVEELQQKQKAFPNLNHKWIFKTSRLQTNTKIAMHH